VLVGLLLFIRFILLSQVSVTLTGKEDEAREGVSRMDGFVGRKVCIAFLCKRTNDLHFFNASTQGNSVGF